MAHAASTGFARSHEAKNSGLRADLGGATATVPPLMSGISISGTDMSNTTLLCASIRSPGPRPSLRTRSSSMFSSAGCSTSTPLGAPVEPEVNRMYAAGSGSAPDPGATARSTTPSVSVPGAATSQPAWRTW